MYKFLKAYVSLWYYPVLMIVVSGILGLILLRFQSIITFYMGLLLPLLSILIAIISGFIKLFKKKFVPAVLQLCFTGILGAIGVYFISFFLLIYPYDFYADDLDIPEDLYYSELFDGKEAPDYTTNLVPQSQNTPYLKLYQGFQPGMYIASVGIKDLPNGELYLKAFELTHEDPLSEERIKRKTLTPVTYSADSITEYQMKFTVYEGDWGKPYAARIEVWYQLETLTPEIMLIAQNYKIEGWQR